MNSFMVVGRVIKDPELLETENGKKYLQMTLAVSRSFKNEKGEYDVDFIDVTVWNYIAESVKDYTKKDDLVGVKGRLQTNYFEDRDGNKKGKLELVAEKVTFLSSRQQSKNEKAQER